MEVAALTSETLKVVANPNGTFTATSDAHPVRVKKGGAWTTIDTTLAKNADGGYSPKASLAGVSFSAGGTGPAVTMQAPDGKSSISVTFPMPLPAPRISGNAAVYPDVLPGVDLRLAASGDAYTEVLVVHDAQAAANPALAALRTHTHAKGLTLKQAGDHGLSGVDKDGKELLHAPQPTMWDSANGPSGPAPTADDAGSGVVTVLPTTVTPTAAAQQRAATTAPGAPAADESDADVTLTPPSDALTGGKVVYPLFIDPWFSYGRQNWLNVSNRGAANWNPNDVARVGLCDFGGANPCPYPYATWRAYFAMDTHFLTMGNGTHATVSSADFYITQTWNGANGCTPTPVDLYSSGGIWNGATWPGPIQSYVDEKSSGGGNGCGSQGLDFNAQSVAQSAANYGWSTSTFALRSPNESDDHQWKKFDNGASLAVTYAYPPNQAYNWGLSHAVTCNGTTYTSDGWPAFSAYGSDNNPQPLNVNLWFEMYAGGDDNATNRLSWNTSGVTVASGNAGSWTENYGDLGAGKNWQFRVNTDNGTGLWGGWTGWYRFTSMHEDLSGLQPPISSFDFPKDQYGNAQWGAPQGYGQLSIGNGGNGNIVGYAYAFDSGGAVNSITIPDCGYQSALGATGIVADAGGAAALPIPSSLAPGHHTVYVKGFDAAHNMTGIGSYEFLVSPAYGVSALAHTPVTGSVTNPFLGRCLDDQNRSLADSAVVDLYTCNGSPAQTWTLTADGSLTTGDPASGIYCLDAYNNGTANGTKIQLFTCNGGANQKWRPQRDANNNWQLVNPVSGRCLDDPWASTTVTSQFQLYDCNSTFAQTWSIDLNPNRLNGPNLVAAATSVGGQTATAVGAPNPDVQKNLTSGPVPFAGNQQLIWWGTGADSATQHVTLTIPFTTPIEADYALGVKLTKATDYGQLTFSVDGTPLTPAALPNGVFDGFTASCCTAQYVPLGGMHLGAAAPHQLTITVVGRNLANTAASPKGFGLGLDFLQASPVNNVVTSSFAAAMNNHGISDDTAASTANLDYAYAPAATDAGTTGTGRALSGPALAAPASARAPR
ncbi:ricin-type beta-trefoil lectin domain protein [Catenulispora yoronensis]